MSQPTTLAAGNFLIPDGTFVAEIVAFALILAVMWKYIVPPLQKSMVARQGLIRQQIEDSREAKERLDAAQAEYAKLLSEARTEAARTREEANRLRAEIIETAKDEARTAAESVTRLAEERLEVTHRQVLAELRREVGQLSVELAGRIVGESLADEALQRRVVDRFLADLDAEGRGSAAPQPEQVR
ncbi:MAG: F0F1 ATP synthase subunit B [Actinomycetota bacterium]|nr:F0F1 ATP synthase subunit B [Actinomycetota bacterium]